MIKIEKDLQYVYKKYLCSALHDNFLFKAYEPRVALGVFRYA